MASKAVRLPATTAVRCVAPGLSWLSRCPAHRSSPSTCRGGGPAISCSPGLSDSLSLYISPSLSLSLGLSVRKLWVVAVELKLQLLFSFFSMSSSTTSALSLYFRNKSFTNCGYRSTHKVSISFSNRSFERNHYCGKDAALVPHFHNPRFLFCCFF